LAFFVLLLRFVILFVWFFAVGIDLFELFDAHIVLFNLDVVEHGIVPVIERRPVGDDLGDHAIVGCIDQWFFFLEFKKRRMGQHRLLHIGQKALQHHAPIALVLDGILQ